MSTPSMTQELVDARNTIRELRHRVLLLEEDCDILAEDAAYYYNRVYPEANAEGKTFRENVRTYNLRKDRRDGTQEEPLG